MSDATETDITTETLQHVLRSLPDDLRDDDTSPLESGWRDSIQLNCWASVDYDDIHDYLVLITDHSAREGKYKRKHGQFNLAGLWKRLRNEQTDTAAAQAARAEKLRLGHEELKRLQKIIPGVNVDVWDVDEPDEADIKSIRGATVFLRQCCQGGNWSQAEIQVNSLKAGEFSIYCGDLPPFTLKQLRAFLKIVTAAAEVEAETETEED